MGKSYEDFIKENQKYIQGYHDKYIKDQCRACFNAIRIGCGTKIVNGKRTHFDRYGCDFDRCKYDEEDI